MQALTLLDSKSIKKIDKLTVIFTYLGSACVKASCKMLMKLSSVTDPLVSTQTPSQTICNKQTTI